MLKIQINIGLLEEIQSIKHGKEIKESDLVLIRNFTWIKLETYFVGSLKIIKKHFNNVI